MIYHNPTCELSFALSAQSCASACLEPPGRGGDHSLRASDWEVEPLKPRACPSARLRWKKGGLDPNSNLLPFVINFRTTCTVYVDDIPTTNLKACTGRRNWTELNWHGLVFDELTNGQAVMHCSRHRLTALVAYVTTLTYASTNQ